MTWNTGAAWHPWWRTADPAASILRHLSCLKRSMASKSCSTRRQRTRRPNSKRMTKISLKLSWLCQRRVRWRRMKMTQSKQHLAIWWLGKLRSRNCPSKRMLKGLRWPSSMTSSWISRKLHNGRSGYVKKCHMNCTPLFIFLLGSSQRTSVNESWTGPGSGGHKHQVHHWTKFRERAGGLVHGHLPQRLLWWVVPHMKIDGP